MFGPLGFQEILFILVIALLIFGPRRLPEIGRTIGKTLAEFRKASTDLKRSINAEMMEEELRQSDPRKAIRETLAEVKSLGTGSPSTGNSPAEVSRAEGSRDGGDSSDSSEPRGTAGAVARSSVDAPAGVPAAAATPAAATPAASKPEVGAPGRDEAGSDE